MSDGIFVGRYQFFLDVGYGKCGLDFVRTGVGAESVRSSVLQPPAYVRVGGEVFSSSFLSVQQLLLELLEQFPLQWLG